MLASLLLPLLLAQPARGARLHRATNKDYQHVTRQTFPLGVHGTLDSRLALGINGAQPGLNTSLAMGMPETPRPYLLNSTAALGIHGTESALNSTPTVGTHEAQFATNSTLALGLHGTQPGPNSTAASGIHGTESALNSTSALGTHETQSIANLTLALGLYGTQPGLNSTAALGINGARSALNSALAAFRNSTLAWGIHATTQYAWNSILALGPYTTVPLVYGMLNDLSETFNSTLGFGIRPHYDVDHSKVPEQFKVYTKEYQRQLNMGTPREEAQKAAAEAVYDEAKRPDQVGSYPLAALYVVAAVPVVFSIIGVVVYSSNKG